jgi:TorA maturation chaperone TorD
VHFSKERLTFQKETLQVRGWYRRFGLEAERLYNEPDDHIGLELEFLAHLARQGLAALEKNDQVALDQALEAQRGFFSEHLARWAPAWSAQVEKHARTEFYRGIAQMTRGALTHTAAILATKPQSENGT